MKWIKAGFHFAYYALAKMGLSIPQKYNWHGVWVERAEKVDAEHAEAIDGRPNEDEINAISAVNQQIYQLGLLTIGGAWLDVGVGSGIMHSSLKESQPYPTWSIACDYSFPSLCYCKKAHNITVVNCSADHLPFSSASFDFILFYSVSQYLSGHQNFLAIITEFERVLKPGGAILIGDVLPCETLRFKYFNPRWFFPDFKRVKRDIHELGLNIVAIPQPLCAPYRDHRMDWVFRKNGRN